MHSIKDMFRCMLWGNVKGSAVPDNLEVALKATRNYFGLADNL